MDSFGQEVEGSPSAPNEYRPGMLLNSRECVGPLIMTKQRPPACPAHLVSKGWGVTGGSCRATQPHLSVQSLARGSGPFSPLLTSGSRV